MFYPFSVRNVEIADEMKIIYVTISARSKPKLNWPL